MTTQAIAEALARVRSVLERRPETGLNEDAPATARWHGGLRVVSGHANGTRVATDMPVEIGGTGDHVSPGWLFRAGIASCAATSIVFVASAEGIELTTLEVDARSRSDARGILGMADAQGERVMPHPCDITLHVRIAARGVDGARLRALVESGLSRSPIPSAVAHGVPMTLEIETL